RLTRRRCCLRLAIPIPDDREIATADLVRRAWAAESARDPREAHGFLASLPLTLYITANIDDLLEDALKAQGKRPIVQVFRWRKKRLPAYPKLDRELTPDMPIVFHLFGRLSQPESLVLTEDDFFDYLMQAQHPESLPSEVASALANDALL